MHPHPRRTPVALAAALLLALVPAVPAAAHVSVQPSVAAPGSFAVVAFRVPTERDDAATTALRVILPEDTPIPSVRTTPLPGWDISTRTRTLDEPLDLHGSQVDEVVSEVTWTATGDGVGPGQFEDFELSLGPVPESGELVFTAIQTYSDGEEVSWSEVSLDESVEPEHPAPVLSIDPSLAEEDPSVTETTAASAEPAVGSASSDESPLPLALSAAALLVALGALALAWRRSRPA